MELVAVIFIASTLFLFMHTQTLTNRLNQLEEKLQPASSNSGKALDLDNQGKLLRPFITSFLISINDNHLHESNTKLYTLRELD